VHIILKYRECSSPLQPLRSALSSPQLIAKVTFPGLACWYMVSNSDSIPRTRFRYLMKQGFMFSLPDLAPPVYITLDNLEILFCNIIFEFLK
jgi:hypothetical protein